MSQPHPHKYIRQATLPQIGPRGQHRLFEAHVGIVGCGTLGCVVADQLARAGVGRLTIADRDLVEAGNLQRQVLFDESDAAERTPKAQAAAVRLSEINADVSIEPVIADFRPSNAESLIMQGRHGKPDVIVDGTDNFETRFLINDLCVKHAIPYVYAGVVGTEAMRAVFDTRQGGACLRCVFDRPPVPGSQPTCETAGVLAPAAAIIGAMQAIEAIKLLLGSGQVATDLVRVDAWSGAYRSIDLCESKDPSCPCCVERCFDHLEGPEPEAASLCGRNAVQVMPMPGHRVDFEQLAAGMGSVGEVIQSPFMVRVALSELPEVSISVFRDGRAVVEGTEDPSRARALYARYVGA